MFASPVHVVQGLLQFHMFAFLRNTLLYSLLEVCRVYGVIAILESIQGAEVVGLGLLSLIDNT